MKILYVTLNSNEEARRVGMRLLKDKLSNCVNFFPITCIYNYEGEIVDEPEVVLIIKTKEGMYDKIREVIKQEIEYDNFIGQLEVDTINDEFKTWLNNIVK